MANSKIIIIEGAQGVGKTTITDYIRSSLPYTNLYRLNGTADSSPSGLAKSQKMYQGLLQYMKTLENASINLLFDRTFFSEEIYCRLGFKEYSFSKTFQDLLQQLSQLDFDIYYITLYLSDECEFENRLKRAEKASVKYAQFQKESSVIQQNAYLALADEVEKSFPSIHVLKIDNSQPLSNVKSQLHDLLQ